MQSDRSFLPFNLNDYWRVKLTPLGKSLVIAERERMAALVPKTDWSSFMAWDQYDYLEDQAWCIIQLFGASLGNGCAPPFLPEIRAEIREQQSV